MSLKNLADKLYPLFIKNCPTDSVCKVFLSASDMKTRAIVQNAAENSPADAWNIALEKLEKILSSEKIEPKILRADWVTSSEKMTWQDFNKLLGETRRNYFRRGLALDEDYKIAFTETEMNANYMLYKDGKTGSKNCIFRQNYSDDYCEKRFGCKFPTPEPNQTVEIFETCGAFVQEDEEPKIITGKDIYAGRRDVSVIDAETFMKLAKSGANYLARQVQKNGRFIYGHYPCFDRIVPSYNSLRHFSSTFAMLDVYGAYKKMPPMKLGKAIVTAMDYAVKHFIIKRKLDDGNEAAYVNDLGELKLGANGVTLLALVKYTELMRTKKYLPLMKAFANGILSMQNPDGSFVHVLNAEDFSVKEPFRIVYYDGEAVFGMMRLYSITKDERLLKASKLAFQRFIATNHWQNHDHWLSYAVNELTLYQPDEKYFEFGINNFLSFLPFIYHRDTQFPTLMELMMAADTMLERMKKMPEMAKLLERVNLNDFYAAMEKRAENLLNGFFWPELAMFYANPESIVGSFFIRHHAFRVRIDDVEHFLSGFVAYCRYLERRKNLPAPIPSQELLNGKAEGTGLFNIQSTEQNSIAVESPKVEEKPAENPTQAESLQVEKIPEINSTQIEYLKFEEIPESNSIGVESFTFEEIPEVKPTEKKIDVEKQPEEKFPTMKGLTDTMVEVFKMLGVAVELNKDFKAPSDYLGENFELNESIKDTLRSVAHMPKDVFESFYESFREYYHSQKPLKQTETDLNIYFCDYVLFSRTNGYDIKDYFDYEFYRKPVEEQKTFIGGNLRRKNNRVGNERSAVRNMAVKSVCSHVFQDFILRDWLAPKKSTLEDFKNFIAKHSKFFAKNNTGGGGTGAEVIQIDENSNVEEIFAHLKKDDKIVEEIISQHEIMKSFCPDTLNTVRINTFLDVHGVVHILTASGRFGRVGAIVDNFTSGGVTVTINPRTGEIISDGLSKAHERVECHPDTGKKFKGFQYPFWQDIRKTVIKMAKVVPAMRHVGWDIAINADGKVDLVEANDAPGTAIQQAADSIGRMHLYTPLVEELENYLREEFNLLGYRVNNLRRFNSNYASDKNRRKLRIPAAMKRIIPDCESLMDLGCRKDKIAKALCPENVKYYPVDYKKYDDEIIVSDFNNDEFPDLKADTCLLAMTAEYVAELPKFLKKVCNAAQKQILMVCRPIDKEIHSRDRWHNQVLTDFTEKFLIETMQENNFAVNLAEPFDENPSFVLYDFRKNSETAEKILPPVVEEKNNFPVDDENISSVDNNENNLTVEENDGEDNLTVEEKNISTSDNGKNNLPANEENISTTEEDEENFADEENNTFNEFKIETEGEEKNNYGLPGTIVKACKFLGLKLPEKNSPDDKEHVPSDYFGENFELSAELTEKIRIACGSLKRNFVQRYNTFTKKFFEQKPLRHNKTDMNIYFCDYMLFAKKMGASVTDYFDFEFYRLPQELRNTFRLQLHRELTRMICNDYEASRLLNRKTRTNKLFAEFVHRDWLSAMKCTFDEFKNFIAKHPKFFAKPIMGSFGEGTAIVQTDSESDAEKIFSKFKSDKMILEEIISQHEIIKSFCPDTLNTVRINTFLDVHGAVHILAASGRFGRLGTIVDNYSSGGHTVTVNPKTGIIISDGINKAHERTPKHPDTGKVFKGFQYPFWEKVRAAVTKMARLIPSVHHVGWDIAINSEGEVELVEANSNPDVHIQQSADLTGRLYLYQPLIDELKNYNSMEIKDNGYKINNVKNFLNTYKFVSDIRTVGIKTAAKKLIDDCQSLIDVGCRIRKPAQNLLPADIKYYPVDYKKRGSESAVCNFNSGDFPDIKADVCLCALTAEFVPALPKFLKNLCIAAQKQILMICRPIDREISVKYRWEHQFVTEFTEEFLIKTIEENNFKLQSSEPLAEDSAVILYDFRRTAPLSLEKISEPAAEKKNIYGLSEGVVKACEFFGLKLPSEGDSLEHVPSDYFGENFELDLATMDKLQRASKLSKKRFAQTYGVFTKKFFSQEAVKPNETNLNIYFADYVLNARKNGAIILDYLDFEFYKKSSEVQKTFRMQKDRDLTLMLCCTAKDRELLDNKSLTNEIFADFISRDWLDTQKSSFEEFKIFIEKNPRFFSKPIKGSLGKGAQIIQTEPDTDLEKLFTLLKEKKRLLEGVIRQHKSLSDFCPDTVNTLRVNTFLDAHNVVHILIASGRFGRVGRVVDNFHGGGFSVIVDPNTGTIISDGINKVHQRSAIHPDTKKVFKGFQYPFWEKVCATVTKMARVLPQIRHVGWDVTINSDGEIELVEANGRPDVDVQQAADSIGRLHIYKPLVDELRAYKKNCMQNLGYRINDIGEFFAAYENNGVRQNDRVAFAMKNLIDGCKSLVDLGCRQSKFVKTICPATVKYIPVDFKNYSDDEIISCNFNEGEFLNVSADTYFCAITAEFVSQLPKFLKNICNAAQKQILMLCRPVDKERHNYYRWEHPFLTDFTEEFLIKTIEQNNFSVSEIKPFPGNRSIILYDFRKNIS